jgi:4-diphosphocytidyl-2-C-methyl-D-erythritol kinase
MNDQLTVFSPAKLNLFLHITGRRADGYHTLQTLFQLLDYGDTLHIQRLPTAAIELECNIPQLAGPDNLIVQAAMALRQVSGCQTGARITLHKHIPMGAGLGGGSSNAASTLLALNAIWGTGLDQDTLCAIGLHLGADVPLFVRGESAWAEGIGEQLVGVDLAPKFYLVICPDCHVSTRDIFSHQQLTRNTTAIKMAAFLAGQTRNDCEALVRKLYKPVDSALIWLSQFGQARMTGTGASVFAAFDSLAQAQEVWRKRPADMKGFIARGLQRIDVLQQTD